MSFKKIHDSLKSLQTNNSILKRSNLKSKIYWIQTNLFCKNVFTKY